MKSGDAEGRKERTLVRLVRGFLWVAVLGGTVWRVSIHLEAIESYTHALGLGDERVSRLWQIAQSGSAGANPYSGHEVTILAHMIRAIDVALLGFALVVIMAISSSAASKIGKLRAELERVGRPSPAGSSPLDDHPPTDSRDSADGTPRSDDR